MKRIVLTVVLAVALKGLAEGLTAYSILTRDGQRMVSRVEGTNVVFELVSTNSLPKDLPPVREWKLCVVKATHTDIGLHNSQYIQRKGSVDFVKRASELIEQDPDDADPAAYRYVCEGTWFLHNTLFDRGEAVFRRLATNDFARGRMGVGCTCAGNHTHVYGAEELCRSAYARRWLKDDWGIDSRTMIMADNPGISWSVVEPYAKAGVENIVFAPNHWNPRPSTIWPMRKERGDKWNMECGGGGSRIDLRWAGELPMLFWWESPDACARLLVCSGGTYSWACVNFGFERWDFGFRKDRDETLHLLARQLQRMERKSPVDLWVIASYGDDEQPGAVFADFAKRWNARYAWPRFETVGDLDKPFDYLRRKFGRQIPVCRGEMTSGWLQHIVCAPSLLAQKLSADRLLPQAEAMSTVAALLHPETFRFDPAAFNAAYWYLIMNDEHSYGTSGYKGRRVFETWMQHRDWIDRAEEIATNALARATSALNVPTPVEPERVQANGRTVENAWYRLRVSPAGEILSIYDKDLGRELLKGPANRFLYTRDNHRSWADPGLLGAEIVQNVYLVRNEKRIDIENRFLHARDLFNSSRYDRYGYLAFPFDVPQPTFRAQLNGPVIDPYRDQTGHCTDAYVGVRDWSAVEGDGFGIALFQRDSFLVEFGEIHPDKTCCAFGRVPATSDLYSYLFTDWLQMHQPDGDSFNFVFRYSIVSYRGTWQDAHLPALARRLHAPGMQTLARYVSTGLPNVELLALKAAEDGNALVVRFRETEGHVTQVRARQSIVSGARYELCDLMEHPVVGLNDFAFEIGPFCTVTVRISADGLRLKSARPEAAEVGDDLIVRPRAGHGEKDGQMYLLWGADRSEDFGHYELYRSDRPHFTCDETTFVAAVTNEPGYATARYEDLGLGHHTRYWYNVRPVSKGGTKGAFLGEFSGLTRFQENRRVE